MWFDCELSNPEVNLSIPVNLLSFAVKFEFVSVDESLIRLRRDGKRQLEVEKGSLRVKFVDNRLLATDIVHTSFKHVYLLANVIDESAIYENPAIP